MSKKLSFREALALQGQTKGKSPERSDFPAVNVLFQTTGPIDPVRFIRLLLDSGVTLRRARMTMDRLATLGAKIAVQISADKVDSVLDGAKKFNVAASRLKTPRANPKEIRERQGYSQAEFASLYGLEIGTLKNWEQGINEPDAPAMLLLELINRLPEVVIEVRAGKVSLQDLLLGPQYYYALNQNSDYRLTYYPGAKIIKNANKDKTSQ